ncbi:MAG: hypothetical protein K5654_05865 [Lachnospiraceae bacterium]|nr:hypothetical protein [Lachnospiraceae bacterium]
MKKVYIGIGVLCLILALIIGGSVIIDKQLDKDSSFLSDHIDFDKYTSTANGAKNTIGAINGYTEMSITEKEAKVSDVPDGGDYEIIVTDIGQIVVEAKLTEDEWASRIKKGLTSEKINEANKECSKLYYYGSLDQFSKQIYLEIYIALKNYTDSFYICSLSPEDIDIAFNAVMADHPEIFYVNGYLFTKYTAGDEIVKIEFTPGFTMDAATAKDCKKLVDEYEKAFMKGISRTASDYEKIKYTYEFIILNTEYDINSAENQNILSVCLYGKSVCQGYAKTFQYLLGKLGVQSTLVVGYISRNNEGHAWNLVRCEGTYYYVDCTWGDSSYLQNANLGTGKGGINYDYLNITTVELELTHVIDNFLPIPSCVNNKNNYYVKEGLYFKSVDQEALAAAFSRSRQLGLESVEIKCSSKQVYDDMKEYLIDENHVFDYLDKENLTYIQNPDLYIYSFPMD